MTALKITNIAAAVIFLGLIGWNVYFEEFFDIENAYEPYRDRDGQEEVLEISPATEGLQEIEEEEQYAFGVSAAHPLAVEAGTKVLENGGNAVEAAIAVAFTLNVVEPYGSGIGGGGMMLVHEPGKGATSYDYREMAPLSNVDTERGVAVPGMVKGMETLYEEYGGNSDWNWEKLLAPAIDYAENGFMIDSVLSDRIASSSRYLLLDPEDREQFYPQELAIERNETLVQESLAKTLQMISDHGAAGFYEGPVAEGMMSEIGFTEEDLLGYEVLVDEPAVGEFEGHRVYGSAAPASSITLIQMLQMAERLDLKTELEAIPGFEEIDDNVKLGDLVNEEKWKPVYIHLVNEITQAAYSSRLSTLADPEFEEVDHQQLTSPAFTDELLDGIDFTSISHNDIYESPAAIHDSRHTSHFVIVDKDGMMVSATNSLGEFFGSGRHVEGFFINNQLENFSLDPEAMNSRQPGKRPRTFVSPLILEDASNERAMLGIGSPGGRRIPAMLFQTIMQYEYGIDSETDERLTLQEAIQRSRFYTEDNIIYLERDIDEELKNILRHEMQYSFRVHNSPLFYGGIQGLGLEFDEQGNNIERLFGGGDPRRNGAWQIGTQDGTQEAERATEEELEEH
ncbi:gamma-glutamyltransferase family protein [Alteribacter populi]|uniref:gamma-glutamyltransferase family protein n=1 Tax=Alteribacter populi TaxID=2011011 RepID=UPI000BBA8F0A|nr:gamma-glutamyltransferase [Alteribacter populi]